MKTNGRNKAAIVHSGSSVPVGVQDGVAGSWIKPQYIKVPSIDYVPGSKQHFENVARQLNRSVSIYKEEINELEGLNISHG